MKGKRPFSDLDTVLRIGIVATPDEPVPPRTYGGTERVIDSLARGLERLGHEVHVFASGDSRTGGTLHPISTLSLRELYPDDAEARDRARRRCIERAFDKVRRMGLDIVHAHGPHALVFEPSLQAPLVVTMHNGDKATVAAHKACSRVPVAAISRAQQALYPQVNFAGVVHNGISFDRYKCRREPGRYLAFLGRMSLEKGPHTAIAIAERFGMPLVMAGKIDAHDRAFYETAVKPAIDASNGRITFIGEVDDVEKDKLLGNAYALVFPIEWNEPFGLVMIESLACGTPVIAPARGSVSEIVADDVTGFIVPHDVDAYAAALRRVPEIDRAACRAHAEERFSDQAMARNYAALYRRLVRENRRRRAS